MKIRGLIIAALIFLVLGGVLYWSDHRKPAEDAPKASDAPPAILKLDASAITTLDIKKKASEPVVLTKADSGKWRITGPKPLDADQNTVSGMITTLSSLNSERMIEDKASDLKRYGLEQPSIELSITEKDNKMRKLLIGDDTPASGAVYVMLAGDPRVFTMASYTKTSLDKSLDDLRNKKLFDFGFAEPEKIELHNGPKTSNLTRTGEDWWLNGKKMDAGTIQLLISKLRDLSADKFVDSGFTTPMIKAVVTSDGGKRVEKLLIAKSGNNYVAKRENEPVLYQLSSRAIDDLQKAADGVKAPAAPNK